MQRCPKCRCDLRVDEVRRESGMLVYRLICANRRCANYRQTVAEEQHKDEDADGG